jgi:hypothetical protein
MHYPKKKYAVIVTKLDSTPWPDEDIQMDEEAGSTHVAFVLANDTDDAMDTVLPTAALGGAPWPFRVLQQNCREAGFNIEVVEVPTSDADYKVSKGEDE